MNGLTVGVYGMGRFGSFWAKSLAASGLHVIGYNRSDRPFPDGVEKGDEDTVLAADALFFCVAISAFEAVVSSCCDRIPGDTLVFDTCSVKMHPMEVMERVLSPSRSYIGTHPMFGPDSASDGLAGLPIVFCPGRCGKEKDEEKIKFWRKHFTGMGLNLIETTASKHDREAAYTQGITHVVGRVLGTLELHESRIATSGYKRLLQVREQTCNDPLQLFMDLQHYNPYTHPMRMELTQSLDRIMKLLSDADQYSP